LIGLHQTTTITTIIIIFVSRLPERPQAIELATTKQQNGRKKTVRTKNI